MRHKSGQLDSLKNMDINELEAERLATQKKIDELTEIYLEQKEAQSVGKAKMLRRRLGYDRPREERSQSFGLSKDIKQSSERRARSGQRDSDSEDEERERAPKDKKRSRSIRFKDDEDDFDHEDKDTPPTRSRSRKARSRVAFEDKSDRYQFNSSNKGSRTLKVGRSDKSAPALKSALREGDGGDEISKSANFMSKLDLKSRGSSRSRSRGGASRSVGRSGSRNRAVFMEPKHGIGGQGTDSRRDAFEAKFDKYRANKRTKETIEKRSKILE